MTASVSSVARSQAFAGVAGKGKNDKMKGKDAGFQVACILLCKPLGRSTNSSCSFSEETEYQGRFQN